MSVTRQEAGRTAQMARLVVDWIRGDFQNQENAHPKIGWRSRLSDYGGWWAVLLGRSVRIAVVSGDTELVHLVEDRHPAPVAELFLGLRGIAVIRLLKILEVLDLASEFDHIGRKEDLTGVTLAQITQPERKRGTRKRV